MAETKHKPTNRPGSGMPNGWVVVRDASVTQHPFWLTVAAGARETQVALPGDGVAILEPDGRLMAWARLLRRRCTSTHSTLYFDGIARLNEPQDANSLGLGSEDDAGFYRVDWETFERSMVQTVGIPLADLPVLEGNTDDEKVYLRELVQLAVTDDLLGPAGGPEEEVVGMGVRARYLLGRLAPRDAVYQANIEGLSGATSLEDEGSEEETPDDLREYGENIDERGKKKVGRRRLPGEEFATARGTHDPDDDDGPSIDAAKNQSFAPSSFGLTVCVGADVETLELDVRWGRYERRSDLDDHEEYNKTDEDSGEITTQVRIHRTWKRVPSGGRTSLTLHTGTIRKLRPDPECPKVVIQGNVREPLPSGDRLVTLFLVNNQETPDENADGAWMFQPEIIVRHPEGRAVFRRRPLQEGQSFDAERDALEMLYRHRLEFGVGHGVSCHAEPSRDVADHAVEVRTAVIPQYEVGKTETPGLAPEDREAMRQMVEDGSLDMSELADMDRDELIDRLTVLTADYQVWITEQRSRIHEELAGHESSARPAMIRCEQALERLREGIDTLARDDDALQAFRFANKAMALQRIRSMYALERGRGNQPSIAELDVRKNRSWRPFQLAFLLLSIPSIADPTRDERTHDTNAIADLIWFPTGGGKTEAYLGVAAFTMGLRRIQSDLGGLDGSRGLSVIMRYTLRLLTLQQFQRATTLICAMEVLRREDELLNGRLGTTPFSIGLWVGMKVSPNTTEASHKAIEAIRTDKRLQGSSPVQLTNCPWCGEEISAKRDVEVRPVDVGDGRTLLFCGDSLGGCEFSKANAPLGLPVVVVDEEIYRRPPTMLIATVDKFAMMAWRGQVRNLFGRARQECPRHGLLWVGAPCKGTHPASSGLPSVSVRDITQMRPPDLIIQDEFHLISGPLGTMVGLYETAVDELSKWKLDGQTIRPKVIASTATVRKADAQVQNVFLRKVAIFPPHGLDVEDNFFSIQRSTEETYGRRYFGICSPGTARPAVLIRVYTALLTAAQELFDHFGPAADPWMTVVGYFNSLRELGGMRRLAEDDVQTRAYRVERSRVERPGLAQRDVRNVDELTSRVSSEEIPRKLRDLERRFKGKRDPSTGRWVLHKQRGKDSAMDVVLATNMLSVGVDIHRLGLMVVNGQPKSTAEYIQATSRVGRAFPGLVCTVLTWARPRDLSHYENFEYYHATFYGHVEAQSVTPFAPRALDRGLTGTAVSWMRLHRDEFNPNLGAQELQDRTLPVCHEVMDVLRERIRGVVGEGLLAEHVDKMLDDRFDAWAKEANQVGRRLGYEKGRARKEGQDDVAGLLTKPGKAAWTKFTVPMSLREVEPGVRLVLKDGRMEDGPEWLPQPQDEDGEEVR